MVGNYNFNIGTRKVGDGQPCFIVAEIGSNHNRDFDLARRLIDEANKSGVDAVKFQSFKATNHYSKYTPGFSYLGGANTYDLIESLELDREWHAPLKQHSEDQGLVFFSSPCDNEAIDQLVQLRTPAFKIASFDLPDLDLIQKVAYTGVPIIMSAGMANLIDIQRAVETCLVAENDQMIVLQCTSLYPAPVQLSNLKAMQTIRSRFNVLSGYSDHTVGDHVAIAAVVLGACLIEKHYTLDRSLPGPDHSFAIEPSELKEMVQKIRDIESAIGDGIKDGPRPQEEEMYKNGRRSVHARVDIPAGTEITDEMLTVKRPGLGIPPHLKEKVVGRTVQKDILSDHWISWDDL
jgi:sialic acid synthase SpsE